MKRRGIPMCRDWRVRYVDAQGKVYLDCVVSAPTKLFAYWNAREYAGYPRDISDKITCWPMPKAKPPSLNVY